MSAGMAAILLELIGLLRVGITAAPAVLEAFDKHREKIADMVDAGVDPTPADFEDLQADIVALRDALHRD